MAPYDLIAVITMRKKQQKGQAMAEFAVAAPVILMLLIGIFLAFFYLWRTANADWGLFAAGAATGSYGAPRSQVPMRSLWEDLRPAFSFSEAPAGKSVSAHIGYSRKVEGFQGIALMEIHRGRAYFRLWRFYPGPER